MQMAKTDPEGMAMLSPLPLALQLRQLGVVLRNALGLCTPSHPELRNEHIICS
jgi:hypothetical protein